MDAPSAPSRNQARAQEYDPKPAGGVPQSPAPAKTKAAHFEEAPADGLVEDVVKQAAERARGDGETLVVYVGASWCEPCQYFHKAVEAGALDADLAGVRFLEFDADRDGERLASAGYDGRLIPRFALPGPDGRFSGTKIEGGIKGEDAVDHIMRRLGPMLAAAGR